MTSIFNFNSSSKIANWHIVDDVVMGGRSNGTLYLNNGGYGVFTGKISLENNGGFSSIRYHSEEIIVNGYSHIVIRLRGDGKTYQLRIKEKTSDNHSYITTFKTSGEWEDISIPLKNMYPSYRGKTLNTPNFSADSIQNIGFLISIKKEESFTLFLDTINLH